MAGDQALARPATQAAIKPACRAVPYSANDRRADEARRATRPHSVSPQPSTYLSANTVSQSLRDGVMDPIRRLIPPLEGLAFQPLDDLGKHDILPPFVDRLRDLSGGNSRDLAARHSRDHHTRRPKIAE